MGPIATKLARELRKAGRANVIDMNALRELKQMKKELEEGVREAEALPPNHAAWMSVFQLLASLAQVALGSQTLRKLADRVDAANEEYMPGGPPSSPILDSVFMSWWMADLTVGPVRESMCSVIADSGSMLGMPQEVIQSARMLAQSRMGVYRVKDLGGDRVELIELVTEARVTAHVPSDLNGRGALWLTRLLPPVVSGHDDWVVWTTPYRLEGPDCEAQWLAYCERALAGVPARERAERIARHFKAADDPRRWTEYIMNGYAGVTDVGEIVLCGVPDRPKTLPQHPDFDEIVATDPEGTSTPLQRVRFRLQRVAAEHDLSEPQLAPRVGHFAELHKLMALAYTMYGRLDRRGRNAVELLLKDEGKLPPDERRELHALAAGWFSAFEVQHIRVDEGMEVRDALGGRTLWISERSATRQVERGDLLVGWVMVDGERITLEGALCHVPARLSASFLVGLRKHRDEIAAEQRGLDNKKRDGLLAAQVAALLDAVFENAPKPKLVNHDGDALLFSTARYDVLDAALVARVLPQRFRALGDGAFEHLERDLVVARLELSDHTLQVQCNSKRRLTRMKTLLKKTLAQAARHRADTYENVDPLLDDERARRKTAAPEPAAPLSALPKEALAQIQAMMLQRMRDWLDEPIPALDGKTPRQATRSERGRDDVTHMLVRQQQIFANGPGLPPIDLQEIWHELGLQQRA